ncbi:MAG TPA: CBS domain-containing protein, partial [Candidatus Polarisedimenticolia bacterium]|nr:CBS domain-containing protein [Candidatus Polarisedimenticolia bacterium]
RLGARLLTAGHLMHSGDAAPRVKVGTSVREAIRVMNDARLGMTCVVEADGTLAGIITDGDLRRAVGGGVDLQSLRVEDLMTRSPVTIPRQELAARALNLLEARKITSLVVVDDRRRVEGVLHLHDLWRTQLF